MYLYIVRFSGYPLTGLKPHQTLKHRVCVDSLNVWIENLWDKSASSCDGVMSDRSSIQGNVAFLGC